MTALRDLRKLPDWALTAYARGGLRGLWPLAQAGMLDRGTYECPGCGGEGTQVSSHLRGHSKCNDCLGWGRVIVGEDKDFPVRHPTAGAPMATLGEALAARAARPK